MQTGPIAYSDGPMDGSLQRVLMGKVFGNPTYQYQTENDPENHQEKPAALQYFIEPPHDAANFRLGLGSPLQQGLGHTCAS